MREARNVLRVAFEESRRTLGGFNRRVLGFALVAAVLAALLWPVVLERGITPDEGLYRAEVDRASPLLPVLRADRQFEVTIGAGAAWIEHEVDVWVLGVRVRYWDDERGRAAVRDLSDFADRYFDQVLEGEANQTAAFPIQVHVVYEPRSLGPAELARGEQGPPPPTGAFSTANDSLVLSRAVEAPAALAPGKIDPPFPMKSLLLTFAYLIPLNFVGQYYASSLLAERTRRRGVLLLSAPITGPQILAGKTLPYALILVVYAALATFFLGARLDGFVASLPIIAFFLSATALAGLLARSQRELTFLITTMSVGLSTYLFLPAIFTQVRAIAYISPVSVVAASIRHEAVPLASLAYAVLPLALAAAVLARLGAAVYREETLFTPRALLSKVVDAVALTLTKTRHFFFAGALVVPFVFGAELLVLAFAASLPLRVALPFFIAGVAIVEEVAKALPPIAHFRRSSDPRPAILVGPLTGLGFALGEKLALVFAIVGLDLVPIGRIFLSTVGVTASLLLVLAPFALHVATATLSSYGARRGHYPFLAALMLAILLHVAYNLGVIRLVG